MTSGDRDTDQRISALADAVEDLFKKGVYLSDSVVHYLASTYDISDPGALSQALSPPFDCEAESICEMVFFPDESQQALLEPLLEEIRIKGEEEKNAAADILAARKITTSLYFPSVPAPCRLVVPGPALRRFIHRIKAERCIDHRITRAINENIRSPEMIATVKVKLRNTRFAFEENRVSALCAFLAGVEENTPDFAALFMELCAILEYMGADKDLYAAMMETRRQYMEMIRQARKNEADLKSQPVEALIMRGTNIAAVNVAEVRGRIDRIDQIAMKIFP
ncbi:MAG: hypothetical protein ACQEQN_09250 [Thermodesulfobacteriota bacterium]